MERGDGRPEAYGVDMYLAPRTSLLRGRRVIRDTGVLVTNRWRDGISLRCAFLGARGLWFGNSNVLFLDWLVGSSQFVGGVELIDCSIGVNESHSRQCGALPTTNRSWSHLGLTSEALNDGVRRNLETISAPWLGQDGGIGSMI